MELNVSYWLNKGGRRIYIEERVPDSIMSTAINTIQIKPMMAEEKGIRPKDMLGFYIHELEEEPEQD